METKREKIAPAQAGALAGAQADPQAGALAKKDAGSETRRPSVAGRRVLPVLQLDLRRIVELLEDRFGSERALSRVTGVSRSSLRGIKERSVASPDDSTFIRLTEAINEVYESGEPLVDPLDPESVPIFFPSYNDLRLLHLRTRPAKPVEEQNKIKQILAKLDKLSIQQLDTVISFLIILDSTNLDGVIRHFSAAAQASEVERGIAAEAESPDGLRRLANLVLANASAAGGVDHLIDILLEGSRDERQRASLENQISQLIVNYVLPHRPMSFLIVLARHLRVEGESFGGDVNALLETVGLYKGGDYLLPL